MDKKQIIAEVKKIPDAILHYAKIARADSLLQCYADSDEFLAVSSDGKMRNYDEFKKLNTEYYGLLKEQELSTTREAFHVIDANLVILGWTGNITAFFRNGDTMTMKEYSVTTIFRKIDNIWKVIHSHESCLPVEIKKA
ncbi:MAG: nuclear transport factor 2 family protein [Bacteroidota bacterium]|nr:nuclear transport factor 2 family protein [Bacteroidota bacterium]